MGHVTAGLLTLELYRWADVPSVPLLTLSKRVTAPPLSSAVVWSVPLSPLLPNTSAHHALPLSTAAAALLSSSAHSARTECYLRFLFSPEASPPPPPKRGAPQSAGPVVAHVWLSAFNQAQLPLTRVEVINIARQGDDRASITLKANATAAFVGLESNEVQRV